MKFFVDTAEIEAIAELNELGMVDGVTTNPSLIMKSGRDIKEVTAEICALVDGPVSAETVATAAEGMIAEGRELAKIADNIAASIRSANHKKDVALIGADGATAPPGVIKAMANHVLTDKGLDAFLKDWAATGQSIL